MSDDQEGAEGVFSMDPEHTLWALARQLVDGQRILAEHGRTARHAAEVAPNIPELRQCVEDFERTRAGWYNDMLPHLAAAMRLAIEVFDTFGPGHTTVKDDVEAAIWNNKYQVWVGEFRDGMT
jgi:hypothetical protein